MSRFRFELAGPADEADLRRILAATSMQGRIAVAFHREPDFFAGVRVEGRFHQVIACRDLETGRIIGFGVRSILDRYVNGEPRPIGYLGALRILPAYRSRGLLARGYAFLRTQHRDGRTPLYLTTIAEGNTVAEQVLLGGRAGLPRYHLAGRFHTLALAVGVRSPRPPAGLDVRPARHDDAPAILELLHREGPRRQFFPCYTGADLFHSDGLLADLHPGDVWLAWRGGSLVGMLAAWDQHRYRQSVVSGYDRVLWACRPVYNAWAWLTGGPRLPAVGQPLRYRMAALAVVVDGDAAVFRALVEAVRAALGTDPAEYLMLGLHEADPLFSAIRRLSGVCYTTRLYLACWDDGENLRRSLDGRPPYLEAGAL